MNKMCKKGIALLMAACYLVLLLTTGLVSVAAAEDPTGTLSDSMILDLKAFEILQGMEDGQLHLDQEITRAEVAKVVATVMDMTDVHFPENYGTIYGDVDSTHWAFSYITMLSSIGLLNGDTDGNFYPDNTVTYAEMTKILVCMLGFKGEAEANGGFPMGYIATGAKLGVTSGVSADTESGLNRAAAMRMVYNSLDSDRLVPTYGTDEAVISSQTYRDLLMGEEDEGLMEVEGVVTANYESYILDPINEMERWQIQVDGQLYDKGDTNIDEYLGMRVKMYVQTNRAFQFGVVKNFEPTKDNDVIELDVQDVASFNADGIEYTPDSASRNTKKTFGQDVTFLYNGRPVSTTDLANIDVTAINDGTIKLISNTQGANINVVMINEYQSFTVDRVMTDAKRIYLADEKVYHNAKYLNLDEDKYNVSVVLKNAEGKDITLEEVKEGDVITIYGSMDNSLLKIYACSNSITGMVQTVVGDRRTVEIDGQTYDVEKSVDLNTMVGKNVIAKLNYLGKIAYLEEALGTTGNYAAIIDAYVDGTFQDTLVLKMIIPGLIDEDVNEAEDDDPTQQDQPMIVAQNDDIVTMMAASQVSFDGKAMNGAALGAAILTEMNKAGQDYLVVSYATDSSGYVRRIDPAEKMPVMPLTYDESGAAETIIAGDKQYNAYDKVFGKFGGAFGLDDSTLGICIPEKLSNNNDADYLNGMASKDFLGRIEMKHSQSYYVMAYEFNEATRCPDVVVFVEPMQYNTPGTVNEKDKIGMITDKIVKLDGDGQQVKGVEMMTPDGTLIETVITDYTDSTQDFDVLEPGDLIYYTLNSRDELDGFEIIQSVDPIPSDFHNGNRDHEIYIGTIKDVEYKVVSQNMVKWADVITMSGAGLNDKTFEVARTSTPPIYLYDSRKKTVEKGTADDFMMEHEKAVVFAINDVVKAVVIVE